MTYPRAPCMVTALKTAGYEGNLVLTYIILLTNHLVGLGR